MKHFDLMALYYPESCIKSEEGRYIEIRPVKNYADYRLCRTKGNINLTDYWFAMVDSGKKQPQGYGCQFISMISDTSPDEKLWFSGHAGQEICCAFFKFRVEELDVSAQDIKNLISESLKGGEDKYTCKWFYTIDNADAILVFFADDKEHIRKAISRIKEVKWPEKKESVFFSDYYVTGKCMNLSSSVDRQENEKLGLCIKDFRIENGNALPLHKIHTGGWCGETLQVLRERIEIREKEKNKKMVAYYQALMQIINVLSQYEQKPPLKDFFYIFYPSIMLFIKQLDCSIDMIRDIRQGDDDKPDISVKEKYKKMQIMESGISEFLDTVEMLMRHMGQSCSDMLSDFGRQGLPYDIPMRLCLMYMSYLNVLTSYLNDTNNEYQFCLAPMVYSRPTTNYIDLGLPPGDRLIRLRVSRHCMFMPRSLLIVLSHETFHYIVSDEQRAIRIRYYLPVMSVIITYGIVPQDLLNECGVETPEDKAILEKYLEIIRMHVREFVEDILEKRIYSETEEPYAFQLSRVFEVIKAGFLSIIYDEKRKLWKIISRIDQQMSHNLNNLNVSEKIIRKLYMVQEQVKKQCEKLWQEDQFHQEMANITILFREIYADLGTVMILDLSPIDYLEAILISESYNPDPDIISSLLVSRVSILKMVMESSGWKSDWEKNWESITSEDLNDNVFLISLKTQVENVCSEFKKGKRKITSNGTGVSGYNGDIMYCQQILQYEKQYLEKCKEMLAWKIKKNNDPESRKILQDMFKQFALYETSKDCSAEQMFDALNKLVSFCKRNIKAEYDSWLEDRIR